MCLGFVVRSDATNGVVFLAQQNHSIKSFRVQMDQHIGGSLTIDGDLNVTGSTNTTSTSDVTAGAPFYRANEGDAIGDSNTTFTGSGLDDAFFAGHFTGTTSTTYYVKIDSVGTPDTFAVSIDNFSTTISTGNAITGSEQMIHSADNISVKFGATTGHTLNDVWAGTASPVNTDTGFFSNRNTGTSGVGYTHMGLFYDASDSKWRLVDEYDPVPAGTINTSHSSYVAGTIAANVEGNVTGNITGNASGNAATASALETARTIGGVSFDGTANINLAGVNTTGNQDTTGNAATATALETARTIQVSGDVTGSASFDGTSNINITTTVQDDSHAHIISNVDGLQSALDAKVPTSRTITAGNGLTGGGDLSANRTLTVGGGTGITVNANDIAIGQDVATTSNVTFNNITVTGTVDGRDVASDGSKLDGIEANAKNDQTITAGGGLTGGGTGDVTISHSDTSSQASVNNSNGTVIQDITLDTYGHITGLASVNLDGRYYTETEADSRFVNVTGDTITGDLQAAGLYVGSTNTSYDFYNNGTTYLNGATTIDANTLINGNLIAGAGGLDPDSYTSYAGGFGTISDGSGWSATGMFVHGGSTGKAAGIVSGSGNIYFGTQDGTNANSMASWLTVTQSTKVANFTSAPTVGGSAIFHDGYHPNADKWTSSRTLSLTGDVTGSVSWDGSGNASLAATVANDSHTHDGRYYTESEADSRFVNVTGDTMTGNLVLEDSELHVGNVSEDTFTRVRHIEADGYGFDFQHDNATVIVNEQGSTNQVLVLGDVDAGNYTGLFGVAHSTDTGSNWTKKLDLRGNGELYIGSSGTSRVFHDTYHPNADKWTTARTLSLSGDASGSVSWDGSANATLSVTVGNDSHTHDGRYYTESESDGRYEPINNTILHRTVDITSNDWNDFINATEASWNTVLNMSGSNNPGNYTYGTAVSFSKSGQAKFQLYANEQASDQGTSGGLMYRTGWNTTYRSWRRIWDSGNDGSGSGLDADLLDGVQGSSYLRSDTDDTYAGNLTVNGVTFKNNSNTTRNLKIQPTGSDTTVGLSMYTPSGSHSIQLYGGSTEYGFLDANWGSWDIQKTKNGAFKVDEGSGLQRVFNDAYHPNADTLTTARTINGVSFNGSANITIADSTKLPLSGGTLTGNVSFGNNNITQVDNISVMNRIYHYADTNTYIQFYNDEIQIWPGGKQMGLFTANANWYDSSVRLHNIGVVNVGSSGQSCELRVTGNVIAYYSDERLKTKTGNIENALDKVNSLEGFYYVENDLAKSLGYNNSQTQVALSAQQVQEVMPECVSLAPFDIADQRDVESRHAEGRTSRSGEDYLTVDYGKLVPLLVESIKELTARVEELENATT